MSAKDCLLAKAQLGLINRELAKEAADLFDSTRQQLDGTMSAADADVQAGVRMQDEMAAQLARKKENRARMADLAVKLQQEIGAFRDEKGVADPGRAMLRLITRDLADKTEGVSNTWARAETVEGVAHSIAEAFLDRTKARWGGLHSGKPQVERIIRAAFGEAVEDVDQVAWEAADHAMDYLRRRFNRAGGAIKFRKDHGPPQMSDMRAVAKVSPEEFRAVVRPLLAPEKMYHPQTGKLGLSEAELDQLLPHLHEKIRTNGWAGTTPGFTRARRSLANRRMDARFLVFKDADSYFAYQGKFGSPDVHDAITSHLHGMSREIGQMEILGPNPDAMITYLKQVGERQAALEGLNTGTLGRAHRTFDSIYDEQTGAAMVPVGGREGFASGFAAMRNVLVSAILGSSAITSLTDLQTRAMARTMAGIPNFGKRIRDVTRLFVPRSQADQRFAVRQMLLAESAAAHALGQHRYLGETVGPRWSRLWADVVLRVSGLTPLTQSGRHLFGLDMLGHFGDYVGRPFTKLPDATQRMLMRSGIDAAQWARLSPGDLIEHGGTRFLDMRKFYETKEDLAIKFHELMLTEREFAVPGKIPRSRAMWRFGKPGTFWGEVSNSVAMLKSFPTSMIMLHGMRLFKSEMPAQARLVMASQLFLGVTLFGMLATQMHELARGRDPRKMDDPGLWLEGILRGGGGGIIGDFLLHDMSQYGESWWKQLGGPLIAFSVDVGNLTLGNVWQAANGQKPRVGRDLTRMLRRYTPGSSIWWMRLALERRIWDELARQVDPEASKQFNRRTRTRQKEHDQRYWWPPGQSVPSREPNLAEAVAPSRS